MWLVNNDFHDFREQTIVTQNIPKNGIAVSVFGGAKVPKSNVYCQLLSFD